MRKNSLTSILGAISTQFMGGITQFSSLFSGLWRTQKGNNQSYLHGNTKSKGGHIGNNGKTWSFVERDGEGYGVFKCRQTGERQRFKIKPVGDRSFGRLTKIHYGLLTE